jgi:hypothetical protein
MITIFDNDEDHNSTRYHRAMISPFVKILLVSIILKNKKMLQVINTKTKTESFCKTLLYFLVVYIIYILFIFFSSSFDIAVAAIGTAIAIYIGILLSYYFLIFIIIICRIRR